MDDDLKSHKLGRLLKTIAKDQAIESIAERDISANISALTETSTSELRMAKTGVEKLAQGKTLNTREFAAVEAIILPAERPVIDVLDGDFKVHDPLWTHIDTDPIFHKRIKDALPMIGRIELPKMASTPYGGTGFVVGENLLMTNRHVAEIFALGEGVEQLRFKAGQEAGIDFKRETPEDPTDMLSIKEVLMVHPYWDMALLRVEGLPANHPHLTLDPIAPEDTIGREVAVIGYPAFDPRNNAQLQMRLFRSRFNVKRLQPGKVNGRGTIGSYGGPVAATAHDASTLGGNSGSAVIDLKTGHVIGLHFAGVYLDSNYAVPAFEMGKDGRIGDAGVSFAQDMRVDPVPWARAWNQADAGEGARQGVAGTNGGQSVSLQAGDGSVTIPLTITVTLG